MVNFAGVYGTLTAVYKPAILLPRLIIPDITHLDFPAFKRNGITGVVIDKDNCISKPAQDELVPRIRPKWDEMLAVFGPANVLIVSNSAGTSKDSLLLQAESVSRNMGVPVLVHATPKPGKNCAQGVYNYFAPSPSSSSLEQRAGLLSRLFSQRLLAQKARDGGAVVWKTKEQDLRRFAGTVGAQSTMTGGESDVVTKSILVIGDRLATDMILANRINSLHPTSSYTLGALPILTTTLHAPESIGTTILRTLENTSLSILRRRNFSPLVPFQPTTSSTWESCLAQSADVPSTRLSKPTGIFEMVRSYWREFSTIPQVEPGRQIVVPRFGSGLSSKWGGLFNAFVERAEKGVTVTESIFEGVRRKLVPEKQKRLRLRR